MNEFIQILEEQGYDSHWDAGQGILVIDNAKQSEFKRIRKILEKAKYKGSFSVPKDRLAFDLNTQQWFQRQSSRYADHIMTFVMMVLLFATFIWRS